MQTIKTWIINHLLEVIIIAGFIIFGIRGCNNNIFTGKPTIDTVHTSHTEYIQQPPVYIPQYVPVQSSSQTPIIIPSQYKPDTTINGLLRQYNTLLEKYLTKNTYKDSIPLKDSSGKSVGVVNLEDVVSENLIKNRKSSYQLSFPITTNTTTITIREPYKPKAQFYFGGSISGSQTNLLSQIGLGTLYKSKKDAIWGAKVQYDFKNGINYEISRYFKLSFKH